MNHRIGHNSGHGGSNGTRPGQPHTGAHGDPTCRTEGHSIEQRGAGRRPTHRRAARASRRTQRETHRPAPHGRPATRLPSDPGPETKHRGEPGGRYGRTGVGPRQQASQCSDSLDPFGSTEPSCRRHGVPVADRPVAALRRRQDRERGGDRNRNALDVKLSSNVARGRTIRLDTRAN